MPCACCIAGRKLHSCAARPSDLSLQVLLRIGNTRFSTRLAQPPVALRGGHQATGLRDVQESAQSCEGGFADCEGQTRTTTLPLPRSVAIHLQVASFDQRGCQVQTCHNHFSQYQELGQIRWCSIQTKTSKTSRLEMNELRETASASNAN